MERILETHRGLRGGDEGSCRGEQARAVLSEAEMRYVSPRDKQNWFARANETVNSIHQNVSALYEDHSRLAPDYRPIFTGN